MSKASSSLTLVGARRCSQISGRLHFSLPLNLCVGVRLVLADVLLHLEDGAVGLHLQLEGLVAVEDASLGSELGLPDLLHGALDFSLGYVEEDCGGCADLLVGRLLQHLIIERQATLTSKSSAIQY